MTDNNDTKKKFNTSNITNNITRHNRNNYEHNVINKGTSTLGLIITLRNHLTRNNIITSTMIFQFQKDWEHPTNTAN